MLELLNFSDVLEIHEKVILPNELQGLAANKSLDAVMNRVENRIHYGLIEDVFDLAATYAVVIAVGHVFNDANKRTAFIAMDSCLRKNGIILEFHSESTGQIIIKVAQGIMNEIELAQYLRTCPISPL